MKGFDASATAAKYRDLDINELVKIAYMSDDYLVDAQEIAAREIERRQTGASKDVLVARARRQLKRDKRDRSISEHGGVVHNRQFREKFQVGILLVALWALSFVAYEFVDDLYWSRDWYLIFVPAVWARNVYRGVQKARAGKPRQLILVGAVPVVLFIAGAIVLPLL
jgi:hypothetical protein